MTSTKRQQLPCWGSPSKNPMYIGRMQRAVEGRVIFLVKVWPSAGRCQGQFENHYIAAVNA